MNLNGMNPGTMAAMNNTNGATPRNGPGSESEIDFKTKLNTYIYDYFLRNEQWDLARALQKNMSISSIPNQKGANMRPNGLDENSMDTDSKDDLEQKKPSDLPWPTNLPQMSTDNSFLLDWFTLFWEAFFAQRPGQHRAKVGQTIIQYMDYTRQQNRMRQEQQNQFVRQPGMVANNMHPNYQNMLRMQGQMGIQPELRAKAALQNNRNLTPAQQQNLMANANRQQMLMQQQIDRGRSDALDMNGRPRTPSGDNAPSPSKRPRLDGPPFPAQGMMQGGRFPQGMPNQHMMAADITTQTLLKDHFIDPSTLTQSQLQTFQQQNPQVQKKTLDIYSQNLAAQHRNSMPQGGMGPQGGMMLQNGMPDQDFYSNSAMRPGMQPNANGQGGNHALQDYQMQLMLLEQQNKKRLLMARQEQDNIRPGGEGQVGQTGFAPNMSPQGSRSGPSPNPSEQMKRGTPKMNQVGLPGSPMPDGSMPGRGSPGAMNFSNMGMDMMKMNGMADSMQIGPNGNVMRPPSSHPQFPNGGPASQQQMEAIRTAQAQGQRLPNGANWQQGPQGQAPVVPQANQVQPQQMGTPQQRTMPPPQTVPAAGAATNGRSASPAQPAASSTPQQTSKPAPKKKDTKESTRKRPTKKTTAVATPSAEPENTAPTPAPATPITPMNPGKPFVEQKNHQMQGTNAQTAPAAPAPAAPVAQQQPDPGLMQIGELDGLDHGINMNFGSMDTGDVLEQFDFDAFLQDGNGEDFTLNDNFASYGNFEGLEAGAGDA